MRLSIINLYISEFVIPLFVKPMRHYRIVKKSTHFLIALSAFAVVFNATVFAALSFGLFSVSKPSQIEAATCSGSSVSISLGDPNTNKEINKPFQVVISSTDDPVPSDPSSGEYYAYKIYVVDVETDKIGFTGDRTETWLGEKLSDDYYDVTINGTGKKIIYARYIKRLDDGVTWCTDWAETATFLEITGVDSTINSPNITMSVPPLIDQGTTIIVSSTITGARDKMYELSISKGGDCPDAPLDTASCWYKFGGGTVASDSYSFNVEWPTTNPGTDIGKHGIALVVWPSSGTKSNPTDRKIIYTTICAPGTGTTTCVSAVDDPDTSTKDEEIDTPDTTDKFSKFTSAFKMPKGKIKGLGDLVIIIIKFLEYLLGVFAFFSLIVSGIQYISSGGDSSKAEKAKKNFMYSVIGIVIAVLALTIQGIIAAFWSGPK